MKPSAALLSFVCLAGTYAPALDIKDYFRMDDRDQAEFDQALFDGAEKALRDEGSVDLADKLDDLFTTVKKGNEISQGVAEYNQNLVDMVRSEIKREAKNPNLPHLQAERAFRDTAEDHGIPLPKSFDEVAKTFKPKYPPKKLTN